MIRLALSEMRRAPKRFAPLTVTLAAVMFLALAVTALADGLLRASTGALRTTDADIFVFADSTWPPSDAEDATVVSGVGDGALSGVFGSLAVISDGRVFAVSPPGELSASLDDDELTTLLAAVAAVVIDALG